MAETTEPREEFATELPSRYLPQAKYRDLPQPRSLRKYMGASVIILATALGSGELILWPYITTQGGLIQKYFRKHSSSPKAFITAPALAFSASMKAGP